MLKNNHHRKFSQQRRLALSKPAEPNFVQWLNALMRDEHGRAMIRARLAQAELAEIQF